MTISHNAGGGEDLLLSTVRSLHDEVLRGQSTEARVALVESEIKRMREVIGDIAIKLADEMIDTRSISQRLDEIERNIAVIMCRDA